MTCHESQLFRLSKEINLLKHVRVGPVIATGHAVIATGHPSNLPDGHKGQEVCA